MIEAGDSKLVRLLASDGSWNDFESNWKNQCLHYGEDFEQFAVASLPVLKEQSNNPTPGVEVHALHNKDNDFDSVIHATAAYIPGYSQKVLRVRHMLMSPHFDFGDFDVDAYAQVIVKTFTSALRLAMTPALRSRHVKFHLRSPAERSFFASMVAPIDGSGIFSEVAIKGSWLHMSFKD